VLLVFSTASARSVDPRVWTKLDIIPMPKEIRLTDWDVTLSPDKVALVVGQNKCRQSEIGAEWINKQLAGLGAAALSVHAGERTPLRELTIIIGTPEDSPLVAQAVRDGVVNVGDKNPGERGYEIRRSPDGRRVYLAGADPIGALYACVTFGELIERRGDAVIWRAAEVRDWPDGIYIHMGDYAVGDTVMPELAAVSIGWRTNEITEEQRRAYLAAHREHYDRLLRWKVTLHGHSIYLKGDRYRPSKAMDLIREGIAYGRERGIGALVYAEFPFVGRKHHYPKLWERMPKPFKGVYQEWVRSWGMDDARRETAEHLAKHLARVGITHVGFHDTDTGSYISPCQWNERSDEDRERWGDDFAAATAHKARIYYDALKKENPDIQVIFTQYPYTVTILDPAYARQRYIRRRYGEKTDEVVGRLRDKTVRFWKGLHEQLPLDVALSIREESGEAVRRFRELTPGRPVFTWNAVNGSVTWNRIFGPGPAWAGLFCHHPHDIVDCRAADIFAPLNSLAVREYWWSKDTPGAAGFRQQLDPDSEIFTLVLPRICRNLFGSDAGPDLAQALAPRKQEGQPWWNMYVVPWHVCTREDTVTRIDPRLSSYAKTSTMMAWQAQMAEDGAAISDRVWARCLRTDSRLGMSAYAFRRFVSLREIYHGCKWMAAIRTSELLANEQQKTAPTAALAAVEEGRAMVEQAREALAQLVRERPDDPVLQRDDHRYFSGRMWRAFMADKMTFNGAEKRLRAMHAKLTDSVPLPNETLRALTTERLVRVLSTAEPVLVDGRIEETAWRGAHPTETLFVEGQAAQVAKAHTRLRLLRRGDDLLAAIQCWAPPDQPLSDADAVELWLRRGKAADEGLCLRWTAAGLAPERVSSRVRKDVARWDVEARIPLSLLSRANETGATLMANLRRSCPLAAGVERSRLLPYDASDSLTPARWTSDPFKPEAQIGCERATQGVQTLADGVVTRVSLYGLHIQGNLVLHDAVLEAEGQDSAGRTQRLVLRAEGEKGKVTGQRAELCRVKCLYYRYEEPLDRQRALLFDSIVTEAAVRLRLTAKEGAFEEILRLGR